MAYVDAFAPERGRATRASSSAGRRANVARLPVASGASVSVDAGWLRGMLVELNERVVPRPLPARVGELLLGILGVLAPPARRLLALRGDRLVPLYWLASLALDRADAVGAPVRRAT